jgi:alpha-tubulin suppressor-like RCC1 family protein
VWAWGDNVSGQIGNGTTGTDVTSPVKVSGLTNVVKSMQEGFFPLLSKVTAAFGRGVKTSTDN